MMEQEDVCKIVLKEPLVIIQLENVTQLLNNALLDGVMTIITVVCTYVQGLHHGILLAIIQHHFVQHYALQDFMQTALLAQDNVF